MWRTADTCACTHGHAVLFSLPQEHVCTSVQFHSKSAALSAGLPIRNKEKTHLDPKQFMPALIAKIQCSQTCCIIFLSFENKCPIFQAHAFINSKTEEIFPKLFISDFRRHLKPSHWHPIIIITFSHHNYNSLITLITLTYRLCQGHNMGPRQGM